MSKRLSASQVIDEIAKFLNGTGGAYDWDDFVSLKIEDQRLNSIRIECAELPEKYPPGNCRQYCNDEGLKRLEEIVTHLKSERTESR
jgi:hypothetical protein